MAANGMKETISSFKDSPYSTALPKHIIPASHKFIYIV